MTKDKAIKKVEIAIDKIIDLQDNYRKGFIPDKTERILDLLRELETYIYTF